MSKKPVLFTKETVHKATMASGRIFYAISHENRPERNKDFRLLQDLLESAKAAAPNEAHP